MNYRHAYHAGNFGDVVKHAVLTLVVEHLKNKDSAFVAVDAHAGVGHYDLKGAEAVKTCEWLAGIGRIWDQDAPGSLAPWLTVVRSFNPGGDLQFYPGSPGLLWSLLRPQDRLVLVEKHPEDHSALSTIFGGDRRVTIRFDDSYAALKALLPPPERRGLVLIDPPYEKTDEFARVARGLKEALKRWTTGIYLIWYPIKSRAPIERFVGDLLSLNLPPTLQIELMVTAGTDPRKLNGAGLIVVNPPWTLDGILAPTLTWLVEKLAEDNGTHRLEWLVHEKTSNP